MSWTTRIGCVVVCAGLAFVASAQDQKGGAPVAEAKVSTAPITPKPLAMPYSQQATWSDESIAKVGKALEGAWRTVKPVGQGDDKMKSADVFLGIAHVHVHGMPDTLYVEAARVDAPWAPFRQALWQIYKKKGEIHVRTIVFRQAKGAHAFLNTLWATPDKFPAGLDLSETYATMDIATKWDGKVLSGKTPYPYPTAVQGAIEMTSEFTVDGDTMSTADRGFDANGKVVWGPDSGAAYQFKKFTPDLKVQRFDSGLIRINYGGTGEGETIVADSRVGLHTVGALVNGTVFENSRSRNQLVAFRVGQDMSVAGFTQGTKELRKGERFKLLIPSDQAFGAQGNPRFKVPGDAWLAYDIEVVSVEAPAPAPAPGDAKAVGPMPQPTPPAPVPPASPAKPN